MPMLVSTMAHKAAHVPVSGTFEYMLGYMAKGIKITGGIKVANDLTLR